MAERQPKRRRSDEQKIKKKGYDKTRARTRINIGEAFQRWRDFRELKGMKTDAEVAVFLLDRVTDCPFKTRTCSVFGCDSWRRIVQGYKLPEDPERRLEWVQFLFEVNGQRLKESNWTDIIICSEHFTEDCFENLTPGTGAVHLKSSAVPSLCLKSESDEPESYQTVSTDDNYSTVTGVSEIVAVIDDESDPMDDTEESGDEGDMESDEDWKPVKELLLEKRLRNNKPDEEDENENDDSPPLAPTHSELCTDCGMFFRKRWPHTCEHKSKPYSCNICGKRCVSEVALLSHSRIHNVNYEHRCKYCHVTFKTKVDKISHEQTHITEGRPYKCPDCSETFATNKDRSIHLEDHRGPPQLKCHICGMAFRSPPYLQRHLAVHTGLKPYKCSVCQRGFNQPSHLKSHIRLHTGERPYKCQHCDKCFNHNVSLKSHVQRYHSSNSGCEQKKEKIIKREGDTGDAEGNGNKRGADSGLDNVEEEQDTEVEEQEERINRPTINRKNIGRPVGRPKSYESGNLVLAVQVEGQRSNRKTRKQQAQKEKRTQCSDEESEDELIDSNTTFHSAEEEEERNMTVIKNTARSRGRPKSCDSDSDFDPEERKKKRCSSQNGGKGLGKRRGRPRKT